MTLSSSAIESHPPRSGPWSVVWTRGRGCAELAGLLAGDEAVRVTGDLIEACLRARADLLVSRQMPSSFDLVSVAVPRDFRPEAVAQVVAAVGGGPHSALAARLAARLGRGLGVPARMVTAYRRHRERAARILEEAGRGRPDLEGRAVRATSAARLVDELVPGTLLVMGEPGGSLVRRLFLGVGPRLRKATSGGTIEVRRAPPRVFHRMVEPQYVSPHLLASDAGRLVRDGPVPVVSEGLLVGLFRPSALGEEGDGTTVGELMEEVPSVGPAASLEEAEPLLADLDGAPLPVADGRGRLVGCLPPGGVG